jgi:hypothetical protein
MSTMAGTLKDSGSPRLHSGAGNIDPGSVVRYWFGAPGCGSVIVKEYPVVFHAVVRIDFGIEFARIAMA